MMELELPKNFDLKEFKQVQRYLYLPALALTVVVGLTAGVVVPNVRKISLQRKEVAISKEELASLEEKVVVLQGLDEDTLLGELIVLESVLPSSKNIFSLIVSLNGLAADNGVALGNINTIPGSIATESSSPSARPSEDADSVSRERATARRQADLDYLEVSADVVGPFDGVSTFITNLERLRPLMKLTTVAISPAKTRSLTIATSSASRVNAKIDLVFFFAPLPDRLGSVGDPVSELTQNEQELLDELFNFPSYEIEVPENVQTGREDPFAPF